jgi:tripartite-type tricarboxylate transporter receptor subunit TctC
LIKRLWAAGGALMLGASGCSRQHSKASSCFQTAGQSVRWLVPFPPGGGYDIYSRLLEPFLQEKIGAKINVENMPGAAGIIAATTLKRSRPDGLTLGIVNAPGLLVAALTGETNAPNPAKDFTILGRIARNPAVCVTRGDSPFPTIDDLLAEAERRPLLIGISEAGSTNFVNLAVMVHLLGINAEFISGFGGSRETSLAVMRGDADLSAFTFESVLDRIEAQDLSPVLQIGEERISRHPSLEGVPLLGGDGGLAPRRATELGRDPQQAVSDAETLARLTGAGLLVAAPSKMDGPLFRCIEQMLYESLTDPAFQAAASVAHRSLDVGRAEEAQADIEAAAGQAERFIPVIREAIRKIRE